MYIYNSSFRYMYKNIIIHIVCIEQVCIEQICIKYCSCVKQVIYVYIFA